MNLVDLPFLTPAELRAMGIDAIIDALAEDQRIDASLPIERDKYQNPIKHVQRTKDAYGKVVEERTIRWTYYGDGSTGEVNEIITEDAKEIATVKHALDGEQPTLTKVAIVKPIEPIPIER